MKKSLVIVGVLMSVFVSGQIPVNPDVAKELYKQSFEINATNVYGVFLVFCLVLVALFIYAIVWQNKRYTKYFETTIAETTQVIAKNSQALHDMELAIRETAKNTEHNSNALAALTNSVNALSQVLLSQTARR